MTLNGLDRTPSPLNSQRTLKNTLCFCMLPQIYRYIYLAWELMGQGFFSKTFFIRINLATWSIYGKITHGLLIADFDLEACQELKKPLDSSEISFLFCSSGRKLGGMGGIWAMHKDMWEWISVKETNVWWPPTLQWGKKLWRSLFVLESMYQYSTLCK